MTLGGDSYGRTEDTHRTQGCAPSCAGVMGVTGRDLAVSPALSPAQGPPRTRGRTGCPSLTPLFALARVTTKP